MKTFVFICFLLLFSSICSSFLECIKLKLCENQCTKKYINSGSTDQTILTNCTKECKQQFTLCTDEDKNKARQN